MATSLPHVPVAFILASLILAITPGPGVFFIVTRSLAQGRRCGLASVAGIALGNLGNAVGAALGLAALFAASSVAFLMVKYFGAIYLIYLGCQLLRSQPHATSEKHGITPLSYRKLFGDGFVVALFNPKTAIFYATFLPQFIDSSAPPLPQSLLLGAIFVAIAAVTDSSYALAAGTLTSRMTTPGQVSHKGARIAGMAFMGLGICSALNGQLGSRTP